MPDHVKIENILQQSDKAELISLVKRMLDRYPDLESLLPTTSKQAPPVDPQIQRNRVDRVFRTAGDDWEVASDIANDLLGIVETGDAFAQRQDYANARVVYDAVVSGVLEHYDEYGDLDEDGELSDVVAACIDGLKDCLVASQDDSAMRAQILHTLFVIYRFDIGEGGIGFGDDAPGVMVQEATAAERQKIAEWVYEAIAEDKRDKPHVTYESHWYNGFAFEEEIISVESFSVQCLGNFLLDLLEETLDDAAYLRICLETGRITDAVQRMLELGRVHEAAEAAKPVGDYELLRIADLFVQSGQDAAAERLVQQRIWKSRDFRLPEWLKKHSKPDHNCEEAFGQARAQFQEQPTLEGYKAVRQLAVQCGYWGKTRPELLAFLKTKQLHEVLTQIALDEDDTDELVKVIQAAGSPASSSVSASIVALIEAAEETQPEVALHFYQRYVACLTGNRNRPAYEQAIRILIRIRTLYEKLGKHENWTRYMTKLHEQCKSMKAFRALLSAAEL